MILVTNITNARNNTDVSRRQTDCYYSKSNSSYVFRAARSSHHEAVCITKCKKYNYIALAINIIIKYAVEISHLHKVCEIYVRAFYDTYGPMMAAS